MSVDRIEVKELRERAPEMTPHLARDPLALGGGLFRICEFEMGERARVAFEPRRRRAPKRGHKVRGEFQRQGGKDRLHHPKAQIFQLFPGSRARHFGPVPAERPRRRIGGRRAARQEAGRAQSYAQRYVLQRRALPSHRVRGPAAVNVAQGLSFGER